MKCSIIIPCYEQAAYLPVAIASVLNQTYTDYEVIIVIDGSPDNSHEVALALAKDNDRIKVYYKENGGLASARNYGVERATGEIILPLDADDKIESTYLEKAMGFFKGNDKDLIVYCNAVYFGAKNGAWKLAPYSVSELCLYNMIFCSAFYRKSSWQKAGGYDLKINAAWADWEFWLSLVKQGCEVVKIEEELFFYYIKTTSMLTGLTEKDKYDSFDYIWQKHKSFISEHVRNPLSLNYENHLLRLEINDLRLSRAMKIGNMLKRIKSIF